jgi:hypothetical protein
MRMALCIYGHSRTVEFCAPSVQKLLIEKYSPDVFICSNADGNVIKKLYNPVEMEIHTDAEINKLTGVHTYPFGEWLAFPEWPQYHIHVPREVNFRYRGLICKQLMQKHEPYDVVFVTRPDIKFLNIAPITVPKKNYLYLPRVDAHHWPVDENGLWWKIGYSAHTWWSSYEVAEKLLDSYYWSEESWVETKSYSGEISLKWYCDKNNIKVKHTDVTQMIIKGTSKNPMSDAFETCKELSATHYPQYCDPPLPIKNHIPVKMPVPGGPFVGGYPGLLLNRVGSSKTHKSRMEKRRDKRLEKIIKRRMR